jgi:PBSX family phage terminase large subunit
MATHQLNKPVEVLYKPRGAAKSVIRDKSPEVLLAGPAGTGKSRACLEKIYWATDKYRGMRALIVRQIRASLSTTGLVTWEKQVLLPSDKLWVGECSREHRLEYTFPNGSVVTCGGLDKPDKIMSSEYDLIYVQEATELKEEGWEALSTRLRNGVMPYQQLLADCNPSAPTHWLKRRCDVGRTKMMDSRHEDNPRLWGKNDWTPFGKEYIAKLDNLTGARKLRLRFGRWAQAEGVVYDNWDVNVHMVDPFPIPREWPRYLAVDFGYTNPMVVQWWARDPDGRLYRYREIYRTKRLVEDHSKDVMRLMGVVWDNDKKRWDWSKSIDPKPTIVTGDHDAEDRATFVRHTGLHFTPAVKAVQAGIQLVTGRLQKAGDGKPRLFLVRGALVDRDQELVEAKRPCCTEEEFDAYVWPKGVDGKPVKEEPVKENDHGMDSTRYLVATLARPGLAYAFG